MRIGKFNGLWQAAAVFTGIAVAISGFWYAAFLICKLTGFELQTTPQYGFTSGIGPMILTALGMATIITGMWHGMNCHHEGCFRVGKHRVNGTPWCSVHQGNQRPYKTENELLSEILQEVRNIRAEASPK